jgi:hypothetical protein
MAGLDGDNSRRNSPVMVNNNAPIRHPLPRHSVLSGFASSPLRGEDNDGFAQQCRREVGVIFGQLDSRTKITPTWRGEFDFCEVQKSSRAVLPPQGGGGEKPKESSDWLAE